MKQQDKREFKEALYGHFARLGQALAHGRRLELLDVLAQSERTVDTWRNRRTCPSPAHPSIFEPYTAPVS